MVRMIGIATALVCAVLTGVAHAKPDNVVDGQYIVLFAPGVDVDREVERQERMRGFRAKHRYERAVRGFSAKLAPGQVKALREDPSVTAVVPDRRVRAFGAVPRLAGDEAPPGVRRIGAASGTLTRQASDVGVAVIDTGIDLSHPDLNAVQGTNCVTPGASAADDEGHGTHVAGTIGARNNGAGVVGVAPGTRLYAVKVLDAEGNGSWSQVICGIDWVTRNASALGIKVANMSLGGPGSNDRNCGLTDGDPLHQAICRSTQAGVLHVVAAGNDRWDIGDSPPDAPATYPEVLTVTAMGDTDGAGGGAGPAPTCSAADADDRFASFSNYASRAADAAHMISAPGVCIRSTLPGGAYGVASGTSMASPHVAGAVALCLGEGGVAGACASKSPAETISHMRAAGTARAASDATYGFLGDPARPNQWGDYFGPLVHVAPDTVAPQTAIASGPTATTSSRSASFGFTSTEPGSTFECRLDAGAWSACASPRAYGSLADGAHTFAVRARDASGNLDASEATRTWTIDATAPDTAITAGPEGATKNTTPTFEFGSAEPGARFECRVDSGAWGACSSPHRTGELGSGGHAFAVRALDALGNADATPAERSFSVDPEVVADRSPAASDPAAEPSLQSPSEPQPATGATETAPATEPAPTTQPSEELGDGPAATEVADTLAPTVSATVARQRLARVLRRGFRATVRASEAVDVIARLSLDGRTAKRLGLSRRARAVRIGQVRVSLAAAGRRTVYVKISRLARRRLAAVRSVRMTLRVTTRDAAGNAAAVSRTVRLSR